MLCPKCGVTVQEGRTSCMNCGAFIDQSRMPAYIPPPGQPYGAPPPYSGGETPTVTGLKYMLIAAGLIIFGTLVPVCGLLAFIGWILAIVGFFKIYKDRDRYPEPHPSNMSQSLALYMLGAIIIILSVVIIVIGTISMVFSFMDSSASAGDMFSTLLDYVIYGGIMGAVGSFFMIIARYKLLVALMPPDKITLLQGVTAFTVVVTIVGLIMLFVLMPAMRDMVDDLAKEYETADDTDEEISAEEIQKRVTAFEEETQTLTWVNTGVSVAAQGLIAICFYLAYDFQKSKPPAAFGAPAGAPAGSGYDRPRPPPPPPSYSSGGYPPPPPPPRYPY